MAGAIVLGNVLPSKDFPDWIKLLLVWVFYGTIVALMMYWRAIILHERFAGTVAVHRMIELELQTGARRVLYTCLLRDWANRGTHEEWHQLSKEERRELERKVGAGRLRPLSLPVRSGLYSFDPGTPRIPAVVLPVVVIGLLTLAASVATIWILTTHPEDGLHEKMSAIMRVVVA